ncbi:MAG TPA: DUF3078 domain-containing protein [Bacteroidales bacterium]|nr:DUF3078 domain-containing protein [Bacteroidales bacterium]
MIDKGSFRKGVIIMITFFQVIVAALGQEENHDIIADSLDNTLIRVDETDTILIDKGEKIVFTVDQAVEFLGSWYSNVGNWKDPNDPLRRAVARLLFESVNDPFYNSEQYIDNYDWETIKIPSRSFFEWDTLQIDINKKTVRQSKVVPVFTELQEDSLDFFAVTDTLALFDTTRVVSIQDTLDIDTIRMIAPDSPEVLPADRDTMKLATDSLAGYAYEIRDSIILVIRDTLREVISTNPDFPFWYYNFPNTGDSIQYAIDLLLDYSTSRDTGVITFKGSDNYIPVLMSNSSAKLSRLWLKNEWGEDISVWIGGRSRDTVIVMVEEGVHFRRLDKNTNIAEARLEVQAVDNSKLAELKAVEVKTKYWKFFSEAAFVFNQAIIKNWVKGGESNISTTLDLTGTADYSNEEKKTGWNSQGRIKFGIMASTDYGVRKNIDQVDLVSKLNEKAFGKFNFSATMLFKTQLAKGYKYLADTSYLVSKFFNPASLTLGLGLDFKPNDNTSINFAPLSYKGTFVPDTVMIDQTKHGLTRGKRAKHEPGMSCQINHRLTFWRDITVINKVQLFTNYIENPMNVDIDWEMILTAQLNWFTEVRLNTHFIYDDNTLIPVVDDDSNPVLGIDGKQKKVPMVQFKEMIGLSVIFRF